MSTKMKRFTETDKWKNPWFRKLAPKHKLLWFWVCDQCDAAGVINPDWGLASFQIGDDVDERTLEEFAGRVVRLDDGYLWIPSFIKFQYGYLSRDCNPQKPVFVALEKHGIDPEEAISAGSERVVGVTPKGSAPSPKATNGSLQDKDKDKDQDKDMPLRRESEGTKPRPRNVLMDALAEVSGIPISEVNGNASVLAKVITGIKVATPNVTPDEIRRRAANYRTHMAHCTLTATALGKHWSLCHAPKDGVEPRSAEAEARLNAF